jgi:hypothetical protein
MTFEFLIPGSQNVHSINYRGKNGIQNEELFFI